MRIFYKLLFSLACALGLVPSAWAVNPVGTACEFYSPVFDKFFVTAQEGECKGLSDGTIDPGTKWGGIETLPVITMKLEGSKPVCRFVSIDGKDSTHAYALGDDSGKSLEERTDECAVVQKKWPNYWKLEDPAHFYADVPVNGVCPKFGDMQTVPLYRIWNQGRGGNNHFLTTDHHRYQEMAWWGTPEGVVMCVAGGASWMGELPKPGAGGGQKPAGKIDLQPDKHVVTPDLVNSRVAGLGADNTGFEIDPMAVLKSCFNSHRVGWGKDSRACSTGNLASGTATIPKVCTNDRGNWTMWMEDGHGGKELWLDLTSPLAWGRTGLPSQVMQNGLVEYGKDGFQPNYLSVVKGANGVDLTVDFGSNCLTGFSKSFEPGDLMFLWHSDKAGTNGQPGWGLGNSTKMGFLSWNDTLQKFTVTFNGLACSDSGNISVYKPRSGSGDQVVWEGGADGFGHAWFAVPPRGEANPQWLKGPGVEWDQDQFLVKYVAPNCN